MLGVVDIETAMSDGIYWSGVRRGRVLPLDVLAAHSDIRTVPLRRLDGHALIFWRPRSGILSVLSDVSMALRRGPDAPVLTS